jgi:hypothetical protein
MSKFYRNLSTIREDCTSSDDELSIQDAIQKISFSKPPISCRYPSFCSQPFLFMSDLPKLFTYRSHISETININTTNYRPAMPPISYGSSVHAVQPAERKRSSVFSGATTNQTGTPLPGKKVFKKTDTVGNAFMSQHILSLFRAANLSTPNRRSTWVNYTFVLVMNQQQRH